MGVVVSCGRGLVGPNTPSINGHTRALATYTKGRGGGGVRGGWMRCGGGG